MGLDAVEIVMRTEDEFSITISDDEAEIAMTVGDLYRVVLAKLDVTPGCLTSRAFYRTRRALINALGVPRHSIRPSTRLALLLPDETRKKQWEQIRRDLGLVIPGLRIPSVTKQGVYKSVLAVASTVAILTLLTGLWQGWRGFAVVPLAAFIWIGLFWAGSYVLEHVSGPRFASELPADTAGELAQVVLSLNRDAFEPPANATSETNEDIWRRLVDIICDQLQVDRNEVVPNARFVDDLGVS
jgi:acyl carrier protein